MPGLSSESTVKPRSHWESRTLGFSSPEVETAVNTTLSMHGTAILIFVPQLRTNMLLGKWNAGTLVS